MEFFENPKAVCLKKRESRYILRIQTLLTITHIFVILDTIISIEPQVFDTVIFQEITKLTGPSKI